MKSKRFPPKDVLVQRAEALGFKVVFVEYVESARYPSAFGPPGTIGGLCDRDRRELIVSTKKPSERGIVARSYREILAILSHEIEHAEGVEVATAYPEFGLKCGRLCVC